MTNVVRAFLLYHAALGGKIVPEHFSSKGKAVPNLLCTNATQREVMRKVVELFSSQDDWILDVNSFEGKITNFQENHFCT